VHVLKLIISCTATTSCDVSHSSMNCICVMCCVSHSFTYWYHFLRFFSLFHVLLHYYFTRCIPLFHVIFLCLILYLIVHALFLCHVLYLTICKCVMWFISLFHVLLQCPLLYFTILCRSIYPPHVIDLAALGMIDLSTSIPHVTRVLISNTRLHCPTTCLRKTLSYFLGTASFSS
jgi:hypothetical protein